MSMINNKFLDMRQRGVSMIETMLVLPVMVLLGFGIVHGGLVFQAQSNLEYAALMAARVGASSNINLAAMQQEVIYRMGASRAASDIAPPVVQIQILNPTLLMFQQCGKIPSYSNICSTSPVENCEIPNFGLQFADPAGSRCANIGDANLLRIKVRYLFDSRVPFMEFITFPTSNEDFDGPGQGLAGRDGRWVTAVSTVRMQSPARITAENQASFQGFPEE